MLLGSIWESMTLLCMDYISLFMHRGNKKLQYTSNNVLHFGQ